MIGWKSGASGDIEEHDDVVDIKLGDAMRGERATLGKSLLDVQRDLKIKANFISAIEDCDPNAFDAPSFISGYVRSYARYLQMDPDWAFEQFCKESGFQTAHGMSSAASGARKGPPAQKDGSAKRDIFAEPVMPYAAPGESIFASIEPRAVGSVLVLCSLLAGLGFGGWTVFQEVQRVELAPIDQAPTVTANLDPLERGARLSEGGVLRPSAEAFDRLYRPQALDMPVLTARDAPIASLSPSALEQVSSPSQPAVSANVDSMEAVQAALAIAVDGALTDASAVQVTEDPDPAVTLFAVRPVWVRVRASDGSVIFEKILEAGEEHVLPRSEEPYDMRAGNSGSLFFKVAGNVYGPAGQGSSTAKNVALSPVDVTSAYALADLEADAELAKFMTVAQAAPAN